MTPEELAEKKKAQIETEFKRYKLISELRARKAKKQKEEEAASAEGGGEGKKEGEEGGDDVKKEPEMEMKLAAKARRKFQKIDAKGKSGVPMPKNPMNAKPTSRWDVKREGPVPEIVNRPNIEGAEEEEDELEGEDGGGGDVKIRAEKWAKKMANEERKRREGGKKMKKKNLMDGEEEERREKATQLREHFEKITQMLMSDDINTEKRQELQEELMRMKTEKEELEVAEEKAANNRENCSKDEIRIAAKHASKMTNKWEKILQKKEKEAKRTKLPPKEVRPASKWAVKVNAPAEIVNAPNSEETPREEKELKMRQKGEEDESSGRQEKMKEREPNEKAIKEEPGPLVGALNGEKQPAIVKADKEENEAADGKIKWAEQIKAEEEAKKREEMTENDEEEGDGEGEGVEDEEEWEWEYVDEEEEEGEGEEEEGEEEKSGKKAPPPAPPKPKLSSC